MLSMCSIMGYFETIPNIARRLYSFIDEYEHSRNVRRYKESNIVWLG